MIVDTFHIQPKMKVYIIDSGHNGWYICKYENWTPNRPHDVYLHKDHVWRNSMYNPVSSSYDYFSSLQEAIEFVEALGYDWE